MSPIHSSMDPIKASPDGDEQREEVARDCLCDLLTLLSLIHI